MPRVLFHRSLHRFRSHSRRRVLEALDLCIHRWACHRSRIAGCPLCIRQRLRCLQAPHNKGNFRRRYNWRNRFLRPSWTSWTSWMEYLMSPLGRQPCRLMNRGRSPKRKRTKKALNRRIKARWFSQSTMLPHVKSIVKSYGDRLKSSREQVRLTRSRGAALRSQPFFLCSQGAALCPRCIAPC